MCGIAGIYPFHTSADSHHLKTTLEHMLATLYHRGPDEGGMLLDKNFAMGMTRLSIIDLSGGQQPISNEQGDMWVVFNGEIFNFVELRTLLQKAGHRFNTHTDTEVIIHAYEEFGLNFVDHLNGQFAIAIWDSRARQLILARDRVGIRPLFYTEHNGSMYFASEMKALAAANRFPLEIDFRGLSQIFTFWVNLPPRTIFRDIHELPPGHLMTVSDKGIAQYPYWNYRFPTDGKFPIRSRKHARTILREQLLEATRLRLRADVPVGAYLSGGLDSSLISAIVKQYFNDKLETFSLAFHNPHYDERPYQEQMAKHLGTRHHVVEINENDIAELFPMAVWHAEKPLLRTAPAPLFALSRLVREHHIKVVLTGEGADEIFAGYNIFKEDKIRRFWAKAPESEWRPMVLAKLYPYILQEKGSVSPFWKQFFRRHLTETDHPFYSHLLRWENGMHFSRFLAPDARIALTLEDHIEELWNLIPYEYSRWHPLNKAQFLEAALFMNGYLLSSQGDRMMMGNSVEGRFPYLDHRLIDFAAQLHPDLKLHGLTGKFILRQAFPELLPPEILNRPKQPYRAPIASVFLSQHTPEIIRELLQEDALKRFGYFNPAAVARLTQKLLQNPVPSARDEMAITFIVSLQILHWQFIEHFQPAMTIDMNKFKIVQINHKEETNAVF